MTTMHLDSLVPNRHGAIEPNFYRYGFQGQEKDDEIKGGEGNSLNYTFRMHDPRVGRFFARDPLERSYPYYSPYAFSGNRVIDVPELEGAEPGMDFLYRTIVNGLTGYYYKLKKVSSEGVKDIVEGGTKSNEHINNNPVYSQKTKDALHNIQKLNGSLKVINATLDPINKVMEAVSPVDDAMTLLTGKINDNFEIRDATGFERSLAGVEVVGFVGAGEVLIKPVKKIIDARLSLVSKWAIEKGYVDINSKIFETTLKDGTELIQYRLKSNTKGDYYAFPGTTPEQIGLRTEDVAQTYKVVVKGEQKVVISTHVKNKAPYYDKTGKTVEGGGMQIKSNDLKLETNSTFEDINGP